MKVVICKPRNTAAQHTKNAVSLIGGAKKIILEEIKLESWCSFIWTAKLRGVVVGN